MIIITNKEVGFNEFRFLTLAINQDHPKQHRYNIGNILVEDGKGVATDGYRLHIVKELTNPLHDGQYRVIKVTKTKVQLEAVECPGDYPDYNRIIPRDYQLTDFEHTNIYHRYAQIIRMMRDGVISFDFLKDATDGMNFTSFAARDRHTPVVLEGENEFALIIPVRG